MFILTDGKNYVMENPMKMGDYLSTTDPSDARRFTFKQARALMNRKGKRTSWVKSYKIVNESTGKPSSISKNYEGKENFFIGENDIEFDESIIDQVNEAVNSIMAVKDYDTEQLGKYISVLDAVIQKYDSAESDITHALQKYREDNDGKRPPANKIAKVAYLLDEIRDKRKQAKQCRDYVQVMHNSLTERCGVNELKKNLAAVKHSDYKARTEYFKMALDYLS